MSIKEMTGKSSGKKCQQAFSFSSITALFVITFVLSLVFVASLPDTNAYTPGNYSESTRFFQLYNASGNLTINYAASGSITINVTTDVDLAGSGTNQNTFIIYDYLATAVSTCGNPCFTQTGAGPYYRYTRTYTLPATAEWYYLRIRIIDNAARTFEGRAKIIVGSPSPVHDLRFYTTSAYTAESNYFRPGSTAYIEMNGSVDTADFTQSSITMFDFQNNANNPSKDAVSTVSSSRHRMTITFPSTITNDWWYPIEPRFRNAGGTDLARARGGIIGIDYSPPNITIEYPQNISYPTTSLWFNVTATDNMTETKACNYSLDGRANITMSNNTLTHFYAQNTTMSEGSHNIRYYCNDSVGNIGNTAARYFTVDTTYPRYSLNQTNSTLAGANILFSLYWTDNIQLAGHIFSMDNCTGTFVNDTYMSTTGTGNWTNMTMSINNTVGCTIRWRYYLNDTAGNMNVSSIYTFVTTDITPPIISISYPQNITYTTSSVWFNVTLNEPGSWCGYSLDGRSNITMTNSSGNWNAQNTSMSDGAHNVRYSCNDTSGNMNSSSSIRYFSVDTNYPKYSLNQTNTTAAGMSAKFSLYWTDNIQLSRYIFSFDNCTGAFANDTSVAMIGTGNWSNATKSLNTTVGCTIRWQIFANDTGGNLNASSIYSFITTDTTPPIISIDYPQNITYNTNSIWFNVTLNEAGRWCGYSLDGRSNITMSNDTLTHFYANNNSMSDGAHNVLYSCNDTSGNMNSTSYTRYFTIDTTSPKYSLNSTNTTAAGASAKFSLYWTDNIQLSRYIFSFDNCTGAFANDTSVAMIGTGNWSNATKSLNTTVGCTIRWRFFANDTVGNMNASSIFSFTTSNPNPQYSLNQTNSTSAGRDILFGLYWQDATALSGYIFSWYNGSNWTRSDSSGDLETGTQGFQGSPPVIGTFTFFDNFDDGALGSNWTTYSSNANGRIGVRTESAYSGAYSVIADINPGGTYNLNELITAYNFSGTSNIRLTFYTREWTDEDNTGASHATHYNGDAYYYTCDGTNWYWLGNLLVTATWSALGPLNISADPSFCSSVTSTFRVKFTQYDNYPLTNDGIGWDDINITYDNITTPKDIDINKSTVTYNDVISGSIYETISNFSVTVNVSVYDNSGSTANANTNPALWLEIYNGTGWVDSGSFSVAGTGNYTKIITNPSVLSAWQTPSNRDIRISARFMDHSGGSTYDAINWTAVWVNIDSSQEFLNDTYTTFTGSPESAWSNVTKRVNSTIGSTIKWRVYGNNTLGITNATNIFSFVTENPNFIRIQSPQNQSYGIPSVWFNVTLKEAGSWCAYSLDSRPNITMTNSSGNWNSENTTMAEGFHNAVFSCNDTIGLMEISSPVYFATDFTPPRFSLNRTNSTGAGTFVLFSLYWTDNIQLKGYIFSIDNGTGAFSNDTYASFSGTGTWSNVTKYTNTTMNTTIRWRFFANDTAGNMNSSSVYSFISGDSTPPVITNVSVKRANASLVGLGDNITLYADVTDNIALSSVYIYITDPYSVTESYAMYNHSWEYYYIPWKTGVYSYYIWANDTSGNSNTNGTFTFNVTANATINIATLNDTYRSNQMVNITGGSLYNSTPSFTDSQETSVIYFPSYAYELRWTNTDPLQADSTATTRNEILLEMTDYSSATNIQVRREIGNNNIRLFVGEYASDPFRYSSINALLTMYAEAGSSQNFNISLYGYQSDGNQLNLDVHDDIGSYSIAGTSANYSFDITDTVQSAGYYDGIRFRFFTWTNTQPNPPFRIRLTEVRFNLTLDVKRPVSSIVGQNITYAEKNSHVGVYSYWTDDGVLNNATLYTNKTGAWAQESTQNLTGKNAWANFTIDTAGIRQGTLVAWYINASDHNANINQTKILSFLVEKSYIENIGLTNISGYLLMNVQYKNGTSWQLVDTIINDTGTGTLRKINTTQILGLDTIWNPVSWNTGTRVPGIYRAWAALTNSTGGTLVGSNGNAIVDAYEFKITYIENITDQPDPAAYGTEIEIKADVSSPLGVSSVYVNITRPDSTSYFMPMTKQGTTNTYKYNFTETWRKGTYSYYIWANDTNNNIDTSDTGTFEVVSYLRINGAPDLGEYGAQEDVNLLFKPYLTIPASSVGPFSSRLLMVNSSEQWQYQWDTTSQILLDSQYAAKLNRQTIWSDGLTSTFDEIRNDPGGTDIRSAVSEYYDNPKKYSGINLSLRIDSTGGTINFGIRIYGYLANGDAVNTSANTSRTISVTQGAWVWYNFSITNITKNAGYSQIRTRVIVINDTGTLGDEPYIGEVRYYLTTETEPPRSSNFTINPFNPDESSSVSVNASWTDNSELHYAWLETNATGTWVNSSFTSLGNVTSSAVSIAFSTAGITRGTTVGIRMYANDTLGNFNVTDTKTIVLENSDLRNDGTLDAKGYFLFRIQANSTGTWQNYGLPVLDDTIAPTQRTSSAGTSYNLSSVWNPEGWDTGSHPPGWYRIYVSFVDSSQSVLTGSDNNPLVAYYPFRIVQADMRHVNITHENNYTWGLAEYETTDNISWINVTNNVSNSTALGANTTLNILNSLQVKVSWGPDERVPCGTGTIPKGSLCISRFDNSTYGYPIPAGATTQKTETHYWNITLSLSNGPSSNNKTVTFLIHNMLYAFSSSLNPDKIIQNSSAIYLFNFSNPWSKNITDINVSVNTPSGAGITANCTLSGQALQSYCLLYNVTPYSWKNATFNISTSGSTSVADYYINATVNYTNPGRETHIRSNIENQILQVRLPGMKVTIVNYTTPVTRNNIYNLNGTANNTLGSVQNNVWLNWTLPSGWYNYSGSEDLFNETLQNNAVLWNNITANISILSPLGVQQIRLDGESTGYFDWDTKYVTVYANTYMLTSISDSNPAQSDTIYIYADLYYDNGTAISGEYINFTDITASYNLGIQTTDSSGRAAATYNIPASAALGMHQINMTYLGSATKYTNPRLNFTNMTVHDKPKINSVNATPAMIGYGVNTTLYANVTDSYDGMNLVQAKITAPGGGITYYTMSNTSGIYFVNYSSWTRGFYTFEILATDNAGKTNTSSAYYFTVNSTARVNVAPVSDSYYPDEYVNLTGGTRTYTSGPDMSRGTLPLVMYNASDEWQYIWTSTSQILPDSSSSTINNRLSWWSDGSTATFDEVRNDPGGTDIRSAVSQYNANPKRYSNITLSLRIDRTNGGSINFGMRIYGYLSGGDSLNTSAHINRTISVTQGAWAWYNFTITDIMKSAGNSQIRSRIIVVNDTAALGDEPDIAEIRYYLQMENASPQYTNFSESTINPDKNSPVTVRAYWTDNVELNWAWVEVNNGTGWYNTTYLNLSFAAGNWSNFTIPTTGLSQGSNVSYRIWANDTNNNRNVTGVREFIVEKSEIINTGPDMFGYLLMKVQTNNTGSWLDVATIIDDVSTSTKRIINSTTLELDRIWNPISWYTDKLASGWYRVYGAVKDAVGNILTNDDSSQLTDTYVFQLKAPKSNLSITSIAIYDVTGKSTHTDTSVLEGSGLNSTHNLYINRTYRVEISVLNNPASEQPWTISSADTLRHDYLNSTWSITQSADIWYNNGTDFTGGIWSQGNITWNTTLNGTLPVGSTMKFLYVMNVTDNTNGTYPVRFLINSTKLERFDYSTYIIRAFDNTTPYIINSNYNLTKTFVNRGETLVGYAEWNKNIAFGYAEYNRTTPSLANSTISTISGAWTNHTITTTSSWLLGTHAFKLYVNDTFGNWNTTLDYLYFDVWGISSISSSKVTTPNIQDGNVTMSCRVTSDNSSALPDYNVTFYTSEKGYLGWNLTNTSGWAIYTFIDSTLNYENATCNITSDAAKLHNSSGTNTSTLQFFTGEQEAPRYSDITANPASLYKGETLNLSAYWTDNNQLGWAWLETNETGVMQNSSLASIIGLSDVGSWSNYTFTMPLTSKLGPWQWRIFANDTSGNLNSTGIQTVTVYGRSAVNTTYLEPSKIYNGTTSKAYCKITDANTSSPIAGYTAYFYNNTELMGTNTTNSTGWAVYNFTDNSPTQPVQYNITCNITDSISLYYNATSENNKKSLLTVINITEDMIAPHLYNNIYGLNASVYYKGQSLLGYALWDETIGGSYATYNSTSSLLQGYYISPPYTLNWTNHTTVIDSTWITGIHYFKLNASDTMPYPNWNNTLPYLNFTVYGYANISWMAPAGSMPRGQTRLQCRVTDNMSGAPIVGYSVVFSNTTDNFLPTKTTNSSGIAEYTLDTTGYPTGSNQFFCTISNQLSLYYYRDTSKYQASQTLTFTGQLNVTINKPQNSTVVNKGETMTFNSTTRDDNQNIITPDTANWYNSTNSNLGSAENISYTIPVNSALGLSTFKFNATKSGYDADDSNVSVYIYGWSNISWQSPSSGSNYSQGSTVPLICRVFDNYTSGGISNYPVKFYIENSTRTWYLGEAIAAATGNATYSWFVDSSTYSNGTYYPKCNITGNSTLYYNVSSSFQSNTTVNITTTGITGAFIVSLVIPPELTTTQVAQYRNLTVNATVRCINGACGTVNGTLQYSNTTTPYTTIPLSAGSPFRINDGGENPRACGSMNMNDVCNLSWVINATGGIDTVYNISVLFDGTQSVNNRTQNATVEIKYILILTVTPDEIRTWYETPANPADNYNINPATNTLPPGTSGAEASSAITVSLSSQSSDANGGVWVMGTNLTSVQPSGWYIPSTNMSRCSGNLTAYPTPNSASSCLSSQSNEIQEYYTQFASILRSGNSSQFVIFLDVPYGRPYYLGGYNGTVWVKVNGTAS